MDLKYIHFFGTSYTAGGGYEFESPRDKTREIRLKLYSNLGEELTQFNFSFPGQLQKLLKDESIGIKVYNHAKSGFGNELIYRKIFDIVCNDKSFNPKEHLFFIEFSRLGRKEYFSNHFNDYVIYNYFKFPDKKLDTQNALNYKFDNDDEKIKKLEELKNSFVDFYNHVYDENEFNKRTFINNQMLINFLENNNIQYKFTHQPINFKEYEKNKNIFLGHHTDSRENNLKFKLTENQKYYDECVLTFYTSNQMTITKETHELIKDEHISLYGNKVIATQIFNNLIELGYFKRNKKNNPSKIILNKINKRYI